jgi:hypothetical protein
MKMTTTRKGGIKIFAAHFALLTALTLALCLAASAQTDVSAPAVTVAKTDVKPGAPTALAADDTADRIKQLEAQLALMQAQIEALKNQINGTPKPETTAAQAAAAKTEAPKTEAAKSETKQPAAPKQLGVDVGSARLTPYGTIYFNAFGNSAGTNNTDVPIFAATTGAGNTSASVRQTRLGVRLEGARVAGASLKAVVEADFFGGFPSVGIGENFGVVRLRLANARLDWEKTSVTVGQDWMVFAPVNPTSLAAAAIPQMAAAGNNWARLPQIKIERKFGSHVTWQGALLAPQTGDFSSNAAFFLQPTSGAAARLPFFQSRLAFADGNWFGTKKAGSVGVSAHYGQSRLTVGNAADEIDSTGVALDWNFPLAKRVTLAGEAFFGRDLAGFQAGVYQNYNPDFAYRSGAALIAGGPRAIGTRGGWTQIGLTPDAFKDRLTLYGSVGIDDPRNEDLVSLTRRDFRSRNFSYAFDAIYKLSPQFSVGAEVRRMETSYFVSGKRAANHVNLSAAYSF